MDPRQRFTATVEQYRHHRPDYPVALLDWLGPPGRAADLGCGTGIFARLLAERGWDVVGVEPNAAMRAAATGVRTVDGSAEATGLPDRSVDLAIGAQAFHWFDLDRALPEIDRIATGHGAAVWNVRESTGFTGAYADVLRAFSSEYPKAARADVALGELRRRRPGGEEATFEHHQDLDREGLIGRAWSSSYVAHGVADRAGFDAALTALFDRFAREGQVRLAYRTRVYRWVAG